MTKLNDQVLTSYKKMLEREEAGDEPGATAQKQPMFSPSGKRKQQTPQKSSAYKTPLKQEVEAQRYPAEFKFVGALAGRPTGRPRRRMSG
jgi:hypothetical protein